MTDSEKIKLIDNMIADFWEFNTEQQRKDGAEAIITAIASVIDFRKEDELNAEN